MEIELRESGTVPPASSEFQSMAPLGFNFAGLFLVPAGFFQESLPVVDYAADMKCFGIALVER